MGEYTLSHELVGERQRLALMSSLLDPIERARFSRLGVGPGWRCLELGCGNGSMAQTLAEAVGPTGHVVASDIDLLISRTCECRVLKSAASISCRT